jgi:hypothetical protein
MNSGDQGKPAARASGQARASKSAACHHGRQSHGYIWDFCGSPHVVPFIRQAPPALVGLPGENHDLAPRFNFDTLNLKTSVLSTFQGFRDISLPKDLITSRHQHPAFCSPSMRARILRTISLFWLALLRAASLSSQIFIEVGKRTKIATVSSLRPIILTPFPNITVILVLGVNNSTVL